MKQLLSIMILSLGLVLKTTGQSDSLLLEPEKGFKDFKSDTVEHYEKDTVDLAINYLKDLILFDSTNLIFDDSVKLAINRLINYVESAPINNTLDFLKNYMVNDTLPSRADSIPHNVLDSAGLFTADTSNIIYFDSVLIGSVDSIGQLLVDSVKFKLKDNIFNYIDILVSYIENDSINFWLTNTTNDSINVWLKNNKREMLKFWLKNSRNDSICVWFENVDNITLRVILEEPISFIDDRKRKTKNGLIIPGQPESGLKQVEALEIEPPAWTIGGAGSFNISQGYLLNWVKGGENSVSTLSVLDLFANYSKGNSKWDNNAQFKYGILKPGERSIRKNVDIFQINTKYGQKAYKNWYYSALFTLKSQIVKGYNYPNDSVVVSDFLAPAYLFFGLGLDFKPTKKISILISPVTLKSTLVSKSAGINPTKYGLAEGENSKRETGAYVKTKLKFDLTKEISIDSKLDLFTNYAYKPQNIDIDWEVLLTMKINKYISSNISVHAIYDDDILVPIYKTIDGVKTRTGTGKRVQFKEILSLGFSYKF